MNYDDILKIIGGLGMFLFGIKLLGDGLQNVAGRNIGKWINKATKTPIHGVMLGIFITVLLQTSSGSTALTIALVTGGMMTFKQASSVILGANIGTTMTAFLIGIKISNHALLFVALGGLLYMFAKKSKTKHMASALMGFGLLFFGLSTMGSPLKELQHEAWFTSFKDLMANSPTLALFSGSILTAIIQSSSAFIGIVQEMYAQDTIGLAVAIPFVLGANIGTTITAILASIGGSKAAKQSAIFQTGINFLGALIALPLIYAGPLVWMVEFFRDTLNLNHEMQLAFMHGIFNVVIVLTVLPLLSRITALIEKTVKGDVIENNFALPENITNHSTNIAILMARNSAAEMCRVTALTFAEVQKYVATRDKAAHEKVVNIETVTDNMKRELNRFIREVNEHQLSEKESKDAQWVILLAKDLERVTDIAKIICAHIKEFDDSNKRKFSKEAIEDVAKITAKLTELSNVAVSYIKDTSYHAYTKARKIEKEIDALDLKTKERHHKREINKTCKVKDKIDFNAMISSLERCGDHLHNIFIANKSKRGDRKSGNEKIIAETNMEFTKVTTNSKPNNKKKAKNK